MSDCSRRAADGDSSGIRAPACEAYRRGRIRRVWTLAIVVSIAAVVVFAAPAGAQPAGWRVTEGDVRVRCPLTIGGSFDARTSVLAGTLAVGPDTAALTGTLAVDLGTLDTGIALRDRHLRENYLETHRGEGFTHAVLSDITLADGHAASFEGRTTFTGSLLLHGTRKPVSGQARISRSANAVRVDAAFPVVLPDFGIPKPRYLGIGVRDEVEVRVVFTATGAGERLTEVR